MQTPDWGALEAVDGVRLSWYAVVSPIDRGASAQTRSRRVRRNVVTAVTGETRAVRGGARNSKREPSNLTATPFALSPNTGTSGRTARSRPRSASCPSARS